MQKPVELKHSLEVFAQFRSDPWTLLKGGVAARNANDDPLAEALLHSARAFAPDHWQSYYELGILHERHNRRDQAIAFFSQASQKKGVGASAVERLIANLSLAGRRSEIAAAIAKIPESSQSVERAIACAQEYARYSAEYPLSLAQDIWTDSVESRGGMMPAAEVAKRIERAISEKKPFALVRLGDGEGTWLHHHPDERRYGAMYDRNRQNFWRVWYGDNTATQSDFFSTTKKIRQDISQADIIGIPPMSWIKHEHDIASIRGYPGTLNAFRVATTAAETTRFTSQLIHLQIAGEGLLQPLLNAADRVIIITCHPQMADFFVTNFGTARPELLLIPGEPSRRHLHGDQVTAGIHYPDRYLSLMSEIEKADFSGCLCLVAGGILGKSYAMAIKRAGGVALDIGSVVDKMLGKKTRPGY